MVQRIKIICYVHIAIFSVYETTHKFGLSAIITFYGYTMDVQNFITGQKEMYT
jgi:hypothetical protein